MESQSKVKYRLYLSVEPFSQPFAEIIFQRIPEMHYGRQKFRIDVFDIIDVFEADKFEDWYLARYSSSVSYQDLSYKKHIKIIEIDTSENKVLSEIVMYNAMVTTVSVLDDHFFFEIILENVDFLQKKMI